MGLFRRRRITRTAAGTYQVRLSEPERSLLGRLADQLRDLLLETTDDPTVRRLFPTAYNEDAERDREYQQLVRDELLERRLAALGTVETTLAADELSEEELSAWLGAINDLRLVLGTRLDVSEDLVEVEADDPDAPAYAVYEYLGFLLSEVVDALSEGLPEPTEEPG
ncbi:DUF2017 family protein [Nitrosomonas communis]|uniref:DUF2017 family protein n=1 Tax=Nitrosomonas communis TaxID=44574 RepID=UPI003D2D0EE0